MRLARWSLHALHVPYRRPVRWSDTAEQGATLALLRLTSDDGREGVAEGTVKPTWSGVSLRSLAAAIEDLIVPALERIDLSEPSALRRQLARVPDNQLAKAMADNALLDLQAAATSTAQRGDSVADVEVSWTLTRDAPSAMAADAEQMIARHGFRTLKIKGGQGIDIDRSILRSIRAAVGAAIDLYVDANSAYAASDARAYIDMLDREGVSQVEDPCELSPDASFSALQAASRLPIVVDLGCTSLREARLFIDRGARAIALKPGRNGRSECAEIARAAEAADCDIHVGMFGESDLGSLAALRFQATLPPSLAALPGENSFFLRMEESLSTVPLRVSDGRIAVPGAPNAAGLVDWAAVARLSI